MAKYQRDNLSALEKEIEAEEKKMQAQTSAVSPVAPTQAAPTNVEEETFKKRYGDIRRHLQTVTAQKDQEIEKLKDQLDDATRGQIKFPKSDEEVEAWAKRYPQVAAIVDTIASKRANEALEIGQKKIKSLEQMEDKINKQRAETELRKYHPDFDNIRNSRAFHDWVSVQPQNIQDALYKNFDDAKAASRAIDLYKLDKSGRRRTSNSAAQAVQTNRASAPAKQQAKFTESQISRMSDTEFSKNEEAIMEAMHNGQIVHDLSGGAR